MMERLARSFNRIGIERFRSYLRELGEGKPVSLPRELIDDSAYSHELPVDIAVELRAFDDRLDMARHLNERIAPLGRDVTDADAGLWAWLSLLYFEQLCPEKDGGVRRPGQDYRHIPTLRFQRRYRHLLFGPFQVYRRHGELARLLLAGPVYSESGVYHEIVSREDLIANKGVLQAAAALYFDARRGRARPGAQGSHRQPGTVRRFVRILQQLDLTYDIYALSGEQVLQLLPPEFDVWRQGQELAGV